MHGISSFASRNHPHEEVINIREDFCIWVVVIEELLNIDYFPSQQVKRNMSSSHSIP